MISITGHFERPKVRRIAQRIEKLLKKEGVESKLSDIARKGFNSKKVELVVAVGGDGTLLRVVRELKAEKPVLGIAAGKRSALMQVKQRDLIKAVKAVAAGKFGVEKRTRLQTIADGKKLPLALNEAMLVNKKSGSIIDYCLKVDGKVLEKCSADGCIVSTPTGSTGHSYSAGGKKIAVGSKKIILVPVNTLGRTGKPAYVGKDSKIVFDSLNKRHQLEVVIDGQPRFGVEKKLVVKKGKDALFVKLN